ncbi:unnamed protein product [Schistosoma mattheei]|uniref:Uncharacterized protein n=1 Tax=Schistosoma mattheei TaxID=31246 RepID=A0A183NKP8_9TREM|nr:unnamed protein product [Schistosoma mattheei]
MMLRLISSLASGVSASATARWHIKRNCLRKLLEYTRRVAHTIKR